MNQVEITLKNNNERERITKSMLEDLLEKYPLEKYIRCKKITIELDGRGYAFPVITLSAWTSGKKYNLLAQFLHEQYHWIEKEQAKSFLNALEQIKLLFKEVPIERPEGGGSELSTYIHLIICRLELVALIELLGKEKAIEIVLKNTNYTWIRKSVVHQGELIDEIITKNLEPKII